MAGLGPEAQNDADLAAQAFDLAPLMVRDVEGRIRIWPGGSARLYGYDAGEAIGQISHELLATEFQKPLREIEEQLLDEGHWAGELSHRRRDNSRIHVASAWTLMPSQGDRQSLVMEYNQDITSLRQAAEDRLRLAALVETSEDAIIGKTLDGVVTAWNPAAEAIFGYSAAEMIGKPIAILFPDDLVAEEADILERLRLGERIDHYETVRLRKGGEAVRVALSVSPIRDQSGRLVGASKIARDITEQVATRARLDELQLELLHVTRLQEMGQMASALAHELNQPLSAASNYVGGVKRLLTAGELQKAMVGCERIADQIGRAGEIIRRLREFVNKGEVQRRTEPVADVIAQGCALALIGAHSQGVTVETRYGPDLPAVFVDKVQVQQVVVNLVRNALEAMADAPKRELSITVGRGGEAVEIAIADTGPGLAVSVRERLFEPFTSTKDNGMGVGLSLCRTIIEAHGGKISAEDRPGGGTIFRFTLPVASQGKSL